MKHLALMVRGFAFLIGGEVGVKLYEWSKKHAPIEYGPNRNRK